MDTNKATLVVMAAGMGSRFGGLKQIEPIGPNGETMLDYSIYDAKKAGFSTVVFIINKRIEADFRRLVGKRAEKMLETEYVFQELDNVPNGFTVPAGRVKPWGTGHAVLQCAGVVNNPFAVINADDFYGQSTYKIIYEHLKAAKEHDYSMAGFLLKNTLTENGTVSRGVCETSKGYLKSVSEKPKIKDMKYLNDDGEWISLPEDTIVSMNIWGFTPTVFDLLEKSFVRFLKNTPDTMKAEFFLPTVIDNAIKENIVTVKVLPTYEKWYGVTYKEDMPFVREGIARLTERGLYDGI